MAADVYTFRLTKADRTPIGEVLNAYERKVSISLSKPSVASFQIRPDNRLLLNLFAEDTLLQVWQNSTLRFWGPVISTNLNTQDDGSAPTIAVSAADPSWRLAKRLAGKALGGVKHTGDKAESARKIIAETNAIDATEINATIGVSSGSSGDYIAGPYKPVLTCVGELAHGFDGFDWYIKPTASGSYLGEFYAAGVIGTTKSNAVFEYGTGRKNMRSMSFLRDMGGGLNRAIHIPDEGLGGEGGETVVEASDATSISNHGLMEEVVDLSGVLNSTLRQQWCQNNVDVRKDPRRILAMTSDVYDSTNPSHVPIPGADYWIGDIVPARAEVEGLIMFNGSVRVYQIDVEVSNNGTAKITPILVDESAE